MNEMEAQDGVSVVNSPTSRQVINSFCLNSLWSHIQTWGWFKMTNKKVTTEQEQKDLIT